MTEVVQLRTGRGGARPGSGRKPKHRKPDWIPVVELKGHFVYVIHEADDPSVCKIGWATDPFKRLCAHQVSTWRRLKIAALISFSSDELAGVVESATHSALSGLHVSGEWFRVSPERAEGEIVAIAQAMSFPVSKLDLAAPKPAENQVA